MSGANRCEETNESPMVKAKHYNKEVVGIFMAVILVSQPAHD